MSGNKPQKEFVPLQIAVVTVSDTRTEENDSSGQYLVDALKAEGHHLNQKHICKDDVETLRALVKALIEEEPVHAVLLTGGTGFTKRDNTVVFCMPGSPGACKTAWEGIIREQLDSRHRPCNFVDRVSSRD